MNSFYMGIRLVIFLHITVSILLADPNVYTWQDGDRKQTIYLNSNYIAEIQVSSSVKSERKPRIIPVTDSKLKSALSKGSLPKTYTNTYSEVFEEGVGGRKMTLPGDIFVEFNEGWDDAKVKDWTVAQNLILLSKLNSNRNIYRIQADPGIESLHLANRLLMQTGVKTAFPNWWRDSARR